VARYLRRRSKGSPTSFEPDEQAEGPQQSSDDPFSDPIAWGDEGEAPTDWFGPDESADPGGYAPRRDAPLAGMLMLGAQSWQRIDGMGLARKALEADATGDTRRDLSSEECFLLANGRAWCLLVHGDLGHQGRNDDPFVLADAARHLELAQQADPTNPAALTTLGLLRLRENDVPAAVATARQAVESFAALPDERRTGRTQAAATLALVTLGLACAASGELVMAQALTDAARAARSPLDLDEAAFAALTSEVSKWVAAGS
jgi:hypothetical protein